MSDIVEVARFDNAFEAHRVVAVLSAAGVEAEVADEHTGSALPHVLAIGVRVVVAREDLERARAALDEDARDRRSRREAGGAGDDADEPESASGDEPPDDAEPAEAPARTTARRRLTDEEAVAWAERTRALAVVGLAVPILAWGALWRAATAPEDVKASPRARALLRQARVVGWTVVALLAALLVWVFRPAGG